MLINLTPKTLALPSTATDALLKVDLETQEATNSQKKIVNTARRVAVENFTNTMLTESRTAHTPEGTVTYWRHTVRAHDVMISHIGAGDVNVLITLNASSPKWASVSFRLEETK